jgi:hypothetical protein
MSRRLSGIKPKIAIALALVHLTMVGLGAVSADFSEDTWLGSLLVFYGNLTGSGTGYGFFAPGVSGQIRACFDIIDEKGKRSTTFLERHQTHEADLRVGNIIDQFLGDAAENKELQRSLAASLAAAIFGRRPEARHVVVRLESFMPVSMAEYREGKRAVWKPMYSADFVDDRRVVIR